MNLGNFLSTSAARNPRKAAIILKNKRITYEQLEHSSASLARWLLRQGCKPGDRIAIHWRRSAQGNDVGCGGLGRRQLGKWFCGK
jgi:acyl-CoA synthetase (AMP-forming)/AMP-acid ligase II